MKRFISLIAASLLVIQITRAQDIQLAPTVIASAGGYGASDNITLSWTLGELAVTTLQQGDLILTQGFQQSMLGEVDAVNLPEVDWEIVAYPNPVKDELKIQFNMQEPNDFWIEIQDVTGRIMSQKQYKEVFPGDILPVNMSVFKYGVYFFRIYTPDRQEMRVISIRKI